jgi:hypothetical protein
MRKTKKNVWNIIARYSYFVKANGAAVLQESTTEQGYRLA